MIFRFILITICVFLLNTNISYSQIGIANDSDVSVSMSPENPGPNEIVTITIETFSFNLHASNVKWYVGSTLVKEGKGIKEITTQTEGLGKTRVVRATIDSPYGQITKTVNLTPSVVTLFWEAKTYTPPFFKGKALFSHQSIIKVVAEPEIIIDGKILPSDQLLYTWSRNGTVLGDNNGYGKKSLSIIGSVISRNMQITVDVQDPNTGATASNSIYLTPIEPEVVTYIYDPLYGTRYNKAITNKIPLNGKEVTVEVVPYNMSAPNGLNAGDISYNWSINGSTIEDGLNTFRRVFRKVGDVFGTSNIGIDITQKNTVLQFASSRFTIDFLKQNDL